MRHLHRQALRLPLAACTATMLAACGGSSHDGDVTSSASAPSSIVVSSPVLSDGGTVPREFTCDGANTSPALAWQGVPPSAASVAIVVDDPDAPNGTFTHWVVANIAPQVKSVESGAVPAGGTQVKNDVGKSSWFGPCPPSGTHHYRFTVYALSSPLAANETASLRASLNAIRSRAIAQGSLVATYSR